MIRLTILLGGVTHFRAIVSHLCTLQSWSGVQHTVFPIRTGPSTVSRLRKKTKKRNELLIFASRVHPLRFIWSPCIILNDLQWPGLFVTLFSRAVSPGKVHLLGQHPAMGNVQLLLLFSWIKKYSYSPRSHAGELLHNGI